MNKRKRYYQTFFSPSVIKQGFHALEVFVCEHPEIGATFGEEKPALKIRYGNLAVDKDDVFYNHDSEEEFFSDYHKRPDSASYTKYIGGCCLNIHFFNNLTDVNVECPSRQAIEAVFNRFEVHPAEAYLIHHPTRANLVS